MSSDIFIEKHESRNQAPPESHLQDPFCIMVWRFAAHAESEERLAALLEASGAQVNEQRKCLFQHVVRDNSRFEVHAGLEDSFAVLTHVIAFSETLREARTVAAFQGVNVYGEAEQLADLRGPLAPFVPTYFEQALGRGAQL